MMRLDVVPGPWLLSGEGPELRHHRLVFGAVPNLTTADLADLAERNSVLGRGGAGFPFAIKLRTAAAGRALRRHIVVNLSEGEPASGKDAGLAMTSPHLVLDGAAMTAVALGVRRIDLVVPAETPMIEEALAKAIRERELAGESRRLRWRFHRAAAGFVSGEASAVTELVDGRVNLPVTSWAPTAVRGVNDQPTFLSNAESFAQVAALALAGDRVPGPAHEPGTRLLSINRGDRIQVREVVHGTPWTSVLSAEEIDGPVLIGGYHGQWAGPGDLEHATVSVASMKKLGLVLGAGVVIPLPPTTCALRYTARIVRYLAGESAGRCGPCVNGLPALAAAFGDLVDGVASGEVETLMDLVRGRGACSHPDGTARLVASACTTFADDVLAHRAGHCTRRAVLEWHSA